MLVERVPGKTLGAVITGVTLDTLSEAAEAEIRAALVEHGVLVFPKQFPSRFPHGLVFLTYKLA